MIKTILALSLFSLTSFAGGLERPEWSTKVHANLIDRAFPEESEACRLKMKLGSVAADSYTFQGSGYAYMHAMRTEDQTKEEAELLMWKFIRKEYTKIRRHYRELAEKKLAPLRTKICFERGMALHPVMDATSPAHAGFKVWDPLDLSQDLEHGDLREKFEEFLGYGLGIPHSHEDLGTLKEMPTLAKTTVEVMRKVDSTLRAKDNEKLRIVVYKIDKKK